MRKNYLVAVCDILGFTQLVEDYPLDSVADDVIGWFRKALHHSLRGGEFPVSPPPTRDLNDHANVAVVLFSDTILVYTKEDTDEAVWHLLQVLGLLLFETILGGHTKIRAGVAYGQAHMDSDNSIYIGQPIIDAHRLEQKQQWAGAALTKSACDRVDECRQFVEQVRWWLTPWNVPLRDAERIDTLAINWNHGVHNLGWQLRWSKDHALPPDDADQRVREKFMNTKEFHEAHCIDCISLAASKFVS